MACCAAAAFFLSQIVLAFEGVRRRLFGAGREPARNDAVMWTPGTAVPARAPRPRRVQKLIVAALVVETVLVAGTAAAWTSFGSPASEISERDLWSLAMESICSSESVAESRNRLNNWIEGSSK